ncbi:hypothetical protein PC120_g18377 [Phytophthora cactorum]|nr:hypothetical protein PC120_g18377 [Phytophthora cactorum]
MFPEALQHRRYQSPDKRNIKLQRRQRAKIRDGIFSTCQAAKGRVGVARLSIVVMLPTNIHESIWADMSVHPSTSIHPPRARSRRFRCEFSNNADVASSSRFVLVSIKAVSCRFRAGFVQNSEDYKSTSTRLQPPFTALSLSVNASHRSPRRYSSPRSTRTWPGFLWKVMEEID